jgi:hypothetical protein
LQFNVKTPCTYFFEKVPEGKRVKEQFMLVLYKCNNAWKPLDICGSSFVETEQIIAMMRPYVQENGLVEHLCVEFENTNVPVIHVNEVRLVAQLAAAYHNACLAARVAGDKDLNGKPYLPDAWHEPKKAGKRSSKAAKSSSAASEDSVHGKKPSKNQADEEWDEEMKGDRRIYDESFQMNEDLVPWKTNKNAEEMYGLYE